jgi:plastocyanin
MLVIIVIGIFQKLPQASSDSGSLTELYARGPDLTKMSLSLSDTFKQTSSNSTKDLHLEFFDAKNNTMVKNVSFFINATKDGKVLMNDLFYTKTGFMIIKFSPGSDMGKWTVNGSNDPILGGWMSENDTLSITTSAFTKEGTYHIHFVVLALVYVNGLVDQSNPPTFDSWWSVDKKGNISKYDNYTISFGSSVPSVRIKDESPLKQFKSGILPENTHCPPNLALIFKAKDGTPACVKYTTANTLIERGWAKKTVLDKTDSVTTVEIPINSSIAYNGFTFTPSTVNTVIGTNNTVRWINLDSVANDVTSDTNFFKSGLIESGYAWLHTFDKSGIYGYHSAIHPWLKGTVIVTSNPLINLKNDTGIITLGNHTYYFETPNYTNDAYTHPLQISFHDVVFTLFPSGFRGGLPTSCGEKYYWTDAKFSDNESELLHIFAGSKCPVLPLSTYFSNHTNPQAGLIFYDGKMKLLVSTNVNSTNNIIVQPLGHTPGIFNETDSTKLRVYHTGGSGSIHIGSDKFNQTAFFSGDVGQVKMGLPIQVSISDPYDMFVRTYTIPSNDIAQDGSFNFTHTFLGKYDQDVYTLDFSYGNQRYELKYYPIVPP